VCVRGRKQALGICRSCRSKHKPKGGKTRIMMNFPTDCVSCMSPVDTKLIGLLTATQRVKSQENTYRTAQARLVLTLSRSATSASMTLTASFTSSCCLRCRRMTSVAVGEAFRSMHTTVRYAFSSSREACCWVLPSSTE
jgi:hypothetical protein